jgi:putative ABC transport system ATP-binding protein
MSRPSARRTPAGRVRRQGRPGGPMALIRLEGVSKTYATGRARVEALRPLDLAIDDGEYLAIMGPSGSGKSTLMNIIGCLDTPSTGRYQLAGSDVSALSDDALSAVRNAEIGYVFQTFNLLPRSDALRNVELPLVYGGVAARERGARARQALAEVGLAERAHHRPAELSGGERQRVAIARALVTNPRLLLADEPTGNLDSQTGAEIMTLFERIWDAGRTIVLVTHEEEIARRARRVLRLRDGRVVSDERFQATGGAPAGDTGGRRAPRPEAGP